MQEFSLSHHADYLSQNSSQQSSFENLLRLEKEHQKKATTAKPPAQKVSTLFVSVVGSSVLFALSAFLWDPSSAQALWKSVLGKKMQAALAVAWLPWVWAHPAKFALVDMLVLVQLVRQPAVMPYLQKEVLPIIYKTFQTMLIQEAWTRTWKWVFAHIEQVRLAVLSSTEDEHSGKLGGREAWTDGILAWPTDEPPSWLVELHSTVVGSVRKGIKSAFKKSVQETVMSASTLR